MKLSIVVPTIAGREESLERTIDAYERTCRGISHEIIVVKDEPTWPQACNAGFRYADADVILFGADDLDPLPRWWQRPMIHLKEHDELPAPRVYDNFGPFGGRQFANEMDGMDGDILPPDKFTRVPIMRRDQWERIGPWPAMIYYADIWLSEKARTLGIETRMVYGFDFFHRWSQIGRVDSKENLDASGEMLKQLRKEMV